LRTSSWYRARSATEAFLYRRLETLIETKGRFHLNVALPIAFDAVGQLEVDLLCADARVAVELDGAQHLADAVAYRRDRRKDQVLQENGYLVLRFLAEDVGKELGLVLDAISRALSHRRSAVPAPAPLDFVSHGQTALPSTSSPSALAAPTTRMRPASTNSDVCTW
jgi:very-short-patch-repair endonuclease